MTAAKRPEQSLERQSAEPELIHAQPAQYSTAHHSNAHDIGR
jgi:hypothetical protein